MKIKEFLVKIKENILEEIFPSDVSCYNCNDEIVENNKYHLCANCLNKIEKIKNPCIKCGEELNSFTKYCNNCKETKRYFNKVVSVAVYNGVAKDLVYKFKFGKEEYVADTIFPFMLDLFNETKFKDIDLILCVPLSKERLKTRGFNQSQILAEKLSKETGILFDNNVIVRKINTHTQTNLNKFERRKNLDNVFEVVNNVDIKDKNILIIDDVITTGSTLNEMAKLLKKNKAKKVYGITFCHS